MVVRHSFVKKTMEHRFAGFCREDKFCLGIYEKREDKGGVEPHTQKHRKPTGSESVLTHIENVEHEDS